MEDNNSKVIKEREKHYSKFSPVSNYVDSTFNDAKNKRNQLGQKWLRNRRLYDKIDENPNLRDASKSGKSTTWEPYTTLKVDQQRARLYELFMPTGDKNFSLFTSNYPILPLDKLRNIVSNLETQYGPDLPKSIIDKAIKEISIENAKKLEDLMEDYLISCNFEGVIQEVTLSSSIFGVGVMLGPMLKEKSKTVYEQDNYGNWITKTVKYDQPYVEYINVFDWFPDLDAKTYEDQDYNILYRTINKQDLLKLADNKTYFGSVIKDFVKQNPDGNFKYEDYENSLLQNGSEDVNLKPKKYRLTEYWGNIDSSLLKDVLDVSEDDIITSVNIIMLDKTVIKCVLNPYDNKDIPIDFFNLYTRGGQLTGVGLCDLLEEKQRQLNSTVRAKFDNMAEVASPVREINTDLFLPQNMPNKLNPGRILFRTGLGDTANYPAIRQYTVSDVTQQLLSLEQSIKRDMDVISSLSGIMTGDMTDVGKTLGRTSSGVGALMGGANTNLKDISKQFDNFLKQFYNRLISVIFLITDQKDVIGDYQVIPKVSTAIIEKQLNANNLGAFINQMQPEQRGQINWKSLTRQQILYNNLDADLILLSPDDIAKNEEQARLQQEQMMQEQSQIQQQQLQIKQQELQLENIKVQGKNSVDMAKTQEILNNLDNAKQKGELDTMLALHKIDNDRTSQSINEANAKHGIMKDEFDRQERFSQEQNKGTEK